MFDNQISNIMPANETTCDEDASSKSVSPTTKEGLFLAENLMNLYVKKQRLEQEIKRCKKVLAKSVTKDKDVYKLKAGTSIHISQSKLNFAFEHKKTNFENISKSNLYDMTRSGVLTPVQRIGLNEDTLKSLPEEKINELLDQKILKQRDVFIGHREKLLKINSDLKDRLAKDGVISLPQPQVKVYAKNLLVKKN
jgi:hypothetical protein